MRYSKVFEHHADYETYFESSDFLLPNVSACIDNDDIHYTEIQDSRVTCIYNNQAANRNFYLFSSNSSVASKIKAIYINGVKQDTVTREVTFSEIGLYEVKYEFNDPKTVPDYFCDDLNEGSCRRVIIPNGVQTIGTYAFNSSGGRGLIVDIYIADTVTQIGASAFFGNYSLLSIKLPKYLKVLNSGLIGYCYYLSKIDAPFENITLVKSSVFENTSLNAVTNYLNTGVNFENIESIASNGFLRFRLSDKLILGPNLTSVGNNAFNSSNITTIIIKATTPPTATSNLFSGSSGSIELIYVPAGSVDAYKAATGWSAKASIIEAIPTT